MPSKLVYSFMSALIAILDTDDDEELEVVFGICSSHFST